MTKKERAVLAEAALEKLYPDAVCTLDYEKPYELLFATRLAAQCTDARVNIVTQTLFKKYPTLESFAEADLTELEQDVRPCGFYRTKAKSLRETAQRLISDFGGEVPGTMEELLSLPGVGRKTANLILGDVFGKPAVVTDTHCIRISGRLGLTSLTRQSQTFSATELCFSAGTSAVQEARNAENVRFPKFAGTTKMNKNGGNRYVVRFQTEHPRGGTC